MQTVVDFQHIEGLQWNAGNCRKGADNGINQSETAQVFLNQSLLVRPDERHTAIDARFHALGCTTERSRPHISFAFRGACRRLRVLSARDMHCKERLRYNKEA